MSLVAVAPVLAQSTNRCTRRKGDVNAQPTNTEKPKMKKTRHHEKVVKWQNESTRVARLQSEPHGRERRRVGQNWLRMKTKAILTCESSKNLTLFLTRVASCGRPRTRPMHKSLHSSKRYCECSTHQQENRKVKKICQNEKSKTTAKQSARHVFYSRIHFGGKSRSIQ